MPTATADDIRPMLDEQRLGRAMEDWARQCGRRLQQRRKTLGWNQTVAARLSGITTSSWSKVELGLVVPRDGVRVAMAFALSCEVGDIWPPLDREYVWTVARPVAA